MSLLRSLVIVAALASGAAHAADRCYQLSRDGVMWSRTPETLCVRDAETAGEPATLTLATGLRPKTVARFSLDLLLRARCIDCNSDVYGLSNPSNSLFNELKISFKGSRPYVNGAFARETGTVSIGATTFHYRALD